MQHVSFVPKPPLAEFIVRFWYSRHAPSHRRLRVVPNGTMGLVFNLDDDDLAFHQSDQPGSCNAFSGAVFSGAHSRPLIVDTRAHVMGVHFQPGGAFRFLGLPASELSNTHVDLETLWKQAAHDLREQLCAASDPATRFQLLERALIARLHHPSKEHRAVRAAVTMFGRHGTQPKTRDVARQLGLSQRHFIKLFSEQVGVTPKVFSRVQRFQQATHLTRRKSAPHWAEVAAACGYYDQSHLIHDFQAFLGLSPTEFQRQGSENVLSRPPLTF